MFSHIALQKQATMAEIKVGLIGGSGLGQALVGQTHGELVHPKTPFGQTSSPITCTEWEGLPICVLARHGIGHTTGPSSVPYRANIFALKALGCTHIIASGACGSLREHIHPGDLVVPDQVIDKTYKRDSSFFGKGIVAHVEFDQPYCSLMRNILIRAGEAVGVTVHEKATYVCMEGPQFSTVAESNMHRAWGGDVIGMTSMPEAKLAREAEISYGLLGLPTDYDCWRPHPPGKDKRELLAEIIGNMQKATEIAINMMKAALGIMAKMKPAELDAPSRHALEMAIWTDRTLIAPASVRELQPILGKYFKKD
jgi:5'-methylthioadenosine phosphorylase